MITANFPNPIGEEHWGIWIALYFFLAGTTGGAYLLSVLFYPENQKLIRRSALWAFLGVVVGSALLVLDLGQPLRFLNLFLGGFYPASVMWLGSWFLLLSGAGLLWVYAQPTSRKAQGIVAVLVALVVGYTAVLLMQTAKPFWNASPLLPWLFLASAATAGGALLQLWQHHEKLSRLVVASALVEGVVLFLHLVWTYPVAAGAVLALLAGPLAWAFWGFVVVGWGLPLFLERQNVTLAALLTLVGAFLLRYFVVMAGQV
ncbi:NrfD/PsrC family molybdoenzyme membrane anchor subunit [Thermus albus]|uniref:NrfD/PsrC family molybdoenzyme membrane anchor subunit n=1 Tax=Thermus albus TaxID=2908146 RepID=UPI001FAA9E00|nr:NrfD/PsrC family molybdoenzyme membrane anchor subunit [Thermus albus]